MEMCSKLLQKPEMLKTARDIDKEEWKQIDEELKVTANFVAGSFIAVVPTA